MTDALGGLKLPGPGSAGGGSLPAGSVVSSTLRWDGAAWVENTALLATAAGDLTLASASPSLVVGLGTGSPRMDLDKLGTGTGDMRFLSAGLRDWVLGDDGSENFRLNRYVADVFQESTLAIANATGNLTFSGPSFSLSVGNAGLSIGSGLGSPGISLNKSDGGTAVINFTAPAGAGNGRWTVQYAVTEALVLQRRDLNGVFVDNVLIADVTTGGFTLGAAGGGATHSMFGAGIIFSSDTTTPGDKAFQFFARARDTTQGLWSFLDAFADGSNNLLLLGGGLGADSPTEIRFTIASALNTAGTLGGTMTSAGRLDWVLDVQARTLYADGDGAGIAATTGITNGTGDAGGTAPQIIANQTGDPLDVTNAGWIKIYVGTQEAYVPYWIPGA